MDNFTKGLRGLRGAFIGIVVGFAVTAIVDTFAKDGLIPQVFVPLIGIIIVIYTFSIKPYFSTLYTIGWLVGSLLIRDLLGPLDIFLNIVVPIIILVIRFGLLIKMIKDRAF